MPRDIVIFLLLSVGFPVLIVETIFLALIVGDIIDIDVFSTFKYLDKHY